MYTVNTFPPQLRWWEERVDCIQQLVLSDDEIAGNNYKQSEVCGNLNTISTNAWGGCQSGI